MGYEHVHLKIQDLSVKLEVGSDALVQRPMPFFLTHLLRRVETYSVPPELGNVPNMEI